MSNDAITLSLDTLNFHWRAARTMKAYLIGISADNLGTLQVTEALTPTRVKHRPNLGRPFSWPLGHDGFVFYQRTGGLPDIVKYSLIVVRDRRAARQAGEILKKIAADEDFKKIIQSAATLASGPAGTGATVALGLLAPVMNIVGKSLKDAKDKVLDTIDGGIHLGPQAKRETEISDTVSSAIARAELDFHLFDAEQDTDSAAYIRGSLDSLRAGGLMIGSA
ncbi:MAG: hypothetical protein ACRBN8_30020 [Nannocystales bacterium]